MTITYFHPRSRLFTQGVTHEKGFHSMSYRKNEKVTTMSKIAIKPYPSATKRGYECANWLIILILLQGMWLSTLDTRLKPKYAKIITTCWRFFINSSLVST